MNDKTIFCALAFGAISLDSNKDFKPCCGLDPNAWVRTIDDNKPFIENINSPSLVNMRADLIEGNWPAVCNNCKKSEEAGAESMRLIWNNTYNNSQANKDINKLELVSVIDPKQIFYLDFTFSTKCNSKCMMCGPEASDFWEEEWNTIYKNTNREYFPIASRVVIDENAVNDIVPYLDNVRFVSFVGGESTISEEHLQFLKLLIKSGKSKLISLSYVTNLTGLSDELLSIWEQFKSIVFSVSIDGYGKVNEYIRYPFKWQKIEKNLRTIFDLVKVSQQPNYEGTKYNFVLSCTVSIFNAIYIPELLEFWYSLLKEYDCEHKNIGTIFLNRLTSSPDHVCNLFSDEYRKQGLIKVETLKKLVKQEIIDYPDIARNLLNAIQLYSSMMQEAQCVDENLVDTLRTFVSKSDEFRNRNVRDYLPEFANELYKC